MKPGNGHRKFRHQAANQFSSDVHDIFRVFWLPASIFFRPVNTPRKTIPADHAARLLRRIRWMLAFFIGGLVLSGVTAFPLLHELNWLCARLGFDATVLPEGHTGLDYWLLQVRHALAEEQARFPFLAYGTDWLAFAHIVIAFFFVAPLRDPVRNIAVLRAGMAACVAVIPLALIAGGVRGIPLYWRLIDCSFGVIGIVPLWLVWRWTRRLEESENG